MGWLRLLLRNEPANPVEITARAPSRDTSPSPCGLANLTGVATVIPSIHP